jgi:uncharacterized protein (DUF302 family)
MLKRYNLLLLLFFYGCSFPVIVSAENSPFVTSKIEGSFKDVLENVKSVIEGRGINIAHILPASDMLNRTGKAFGVAEPVYSNAETVEFCSAKISHKLSKANPENIALCPFTISVYELTKKPKVIYLTYRKPMAGSESTTEAKMVEDFVSGIVKEVVDF